MNTTKKEVKVGLIGVGLNTYWNQFEGLLSRLTDYQRMIKERMSSLQATVIEPATGTVVMYFFFGHK